MSYSDIGALPQQLMAEDSPIEGSDVTLQLVDDLIKKDASFLMDPSRAFIDPSENLALYNEETMPASSVPNLLNQQEYGFMCSHRSGPPVQTVHPGIFNFSAKVTTNNKKYMYSEDLNKVYVDMNCDFAVQFTWDNACDVMFVRACVVFAGKEHAEKRVECCMQHRHDPATDEEKIRLNVLRSSRALGTQGVYYYGDPSVPDSWYSVLVEFAAPSRPRTHAYKFVCKNSCSSGINRRAIAIIFTLEDFDGTVHGRQVIGARVCSCPLRDRLKDEEAAGIQRSAKRQTKPDARKSKKVKIETLTSSSLDEGVFTLPPVQVVGVNVVIAGLDIMAKMMEHGKSLRKDDAQYVHDCDVSIGNLRAAIEQYTRGNNLP